jgi:hypothetical protein
VLILKPVSLPNSATTFASQDNAFHLPVQDQVDVLLDRGGDCANAERSAADRPYSHLPGRPVFQRGSAERTHEAPSHKACPVCPMPATKRLFGQGKRLQADRALSWPRVYPAWTGRYMYGESRRSREASEGIVCYRPEVGHSLLLGTEKVDLCDAWDHCR